MQFVGIRRLPMKSRKLILALASTLAIAGCHHGSDHARTTPPQPDFHNRTPHPMAARIPASPGMRRIMPTSWVFFATDSERLSLGAQADLDAAAAWLKAHPAEHVLVEGHADVDGPPDYNMQLSFRRGIAVADYLVAHGVARARIAIDPQGQNFAKPGSKPADRHAIVYATGTPGIR